MSFLLLSDDFNIAGLLPTSAWTSLGTNTWTSDGQRVRSDSAPQVGKSTVLNSDPYPLLTVAPVAIRVMEAEVQVIFPAVLSSTQVTQGGLVLFSTSGASFPHFEAVIHRDGGTNSSRMIFFLRSNLGVQTIITSVLPLVPTISAGETHTVKVRVTIANAAEFVAEMFFDGIPQGTHIITSSQMATWGFPGNSQTNAHRVGIFSFVPGPAAASGFPQYPLYLDNLRVRDAGLLANSPLTFPEPVLVADPVLASATLDTESDLGRTDILAPDYAIEIGDDRPIAEVRYDSGHSATFPLTGKRRRTWSGAWKSLNVTRKMQLEESILDRQVMDFIDPETGQAMKVRFTSDITISQVDPGVYEARGSFEEVYA